MTSSLKAFFADKETATYFNVSKAVMPGHCNQQVTFTLDPDFGGRDWPPTLLAIWKGIPDSKGEQTREFIYMDPDDARSIAAALNAYADAWQGPWDRFENGDDWQGGV